MRDAELARLQARADRGDEDAIREIEKHARRDEGASGIAGDAHADQHREGAADEIRRRLGGAGAVKRQETESATIAERVAASLSKRGIAATVEGATVVFSDGDLFAIGAAGLVAPVTEDGTELVARFDRGPFVVTDDEHGRRIPEWPQPVWAVLRPTLGAILTAETAAELEKMERCPHCGRKTGLGYRRYGFACRKRGGEWIVLGSTCAADFLGVKAEALFPHREIENRSGRLLQEIVDAETAAQMEVQRMERHDAAMRRFSDVLRDRNSEAYGLDGARRIEVALAATIERENLQDGALYNVLGELRRGSATPTRRQWTSATGEPVYVLTRFGSRLAEWFERGAADVDLDPPTPARFEQSSIEEGERGSWRGIVSHVRRFHGTKNRYKRPYQGVTLRLNGTRVWFPVAENRDVQEGDELTVTARVATKKSSTMAFLSHVRSVEGLRPDLDDEDEG